MTCMYQQDFHDFFLALEGQNILTQKQLCNSKTDVIYNVCIHVNFLRDFSILIYFAKGSMTHQIFRITNSEIGISVWLSQIIFL